MASNTESPAETLILRSLKQPNTETTIASAPLPTSSGVGGGDDDGTGNKFPFQNRSHPNDPASDILPYPAPIIRKKSNANKQQFVLLTSKEAREAKLREIQQKATREENKRVKEELKAKKQQEKLQRRGKETMTNDNHEAITGRSNLKTKHQSHTVVDAHSLSKSTLKQQEFQENKVKKNKNTQ